MAGEQPKKVAGGAFGQYLAEQRPALMKECAGKPITAVTKLASEKFKALDASAKAKYEAMYQAAKNKYEKDMAAFIAAGGEVKARKSKKDKKMKKTKDPNRPKKPAGGAYGCFLAKNRQAFMKECAGKPITAVSKLAGERWKLLADSDKKVFEKEYEAKLAEYKKAMESYVPPAVAAEEEEEEDEEEDDEAEEEDDEDDDGEEKDISSKKRKQGDKQSAAPATKKGKSSSAEVEAEAKKLGYTTKLKTIMGNDKVKFSASEILEELKKSNGSVVATKKALLGA
jgi:hypothetical protein